MEYKNLETKNDRWIVEHVFPDEYGKYFIELGACNGIAASSCYVLEKYFQWSGICVEPNRNYYRELVKNRPNSICENLCISDINGIVVYLQGNEATVHPMLGGIRSNLIKYRRDTQEILHQGQEIKQESITLKDLLHKHNAPKVIHYLAIDIEGSELPTLTVFPFQEYQILAISVEGTHCNDLLVAQGYINVKNPFNTDNLYEQYFLHKSIVEQKDIEINAQHYLSLGNNFTRENKLSKAISAYQKAINIEPENSNFHALIGTIYKQQGDMEKAIYSFHKALEINPQFAPWIYFGIANALQKQEKFTQAVATYYQGIKLAVEIPVWVYQCLGDILIKQQRWNEAIAAYEQAQKLEPDNEHFVQKLILAQDEKSKESLN